MNIAPSFPSSSEPRPHLLDTRLFPREARIKAFADHVHKGPRSLKRKLSFFPLSDQNENVIVDDRLVAENCYVSRLNTSGFKANVEDPPGPGASFEAVTVGLMERGAGETRASTGDFKLKPGDIFLHATTNFETSFAESRVLRLVFPAGSLLKLFRQKGEFLVVSGSDQVAPLLKTAVGELERLLRGETEGSVPLMSRIAVQLASQVLEDHIAHTEVSGHDIIRGRAIEYILDNLTRVDLSVDELMAYLGVSRSTLYRAFESLGGVSGYITFLRIEKARALIGNGTADTAGLSAIAYSCGFVDSNAMNRAFKRNYGISPTRYQNDQI